MITSLNIRLAFSSLSSATTACGLQSAVSAYFKLDLSIFGLDRASCYQAPSAGFGQCDVQMKLRLAQAKQACQQQLTAFLGAQISREGGDKEECRTALDRCSRETRAECRSEVAATVCQSKSKECEKDTRSCDCLLYTSPSPRDRTRSRMPSSA